MEGQASEENVGSRLRLPGIEQHIEPLPRRQKRLGHSFRPLYQAAIGADDGELQRCFAVDEGKPVDARIGPVQQPQPVGARGDALDGIGREVGQHDVAQPPHHGFVHVRLVEQPSLRIEPLVLDDQGQVGDAELQIEGLVEHALILVVHQQEARQAVISLLGRQLMRMGVVPVCPAAVEHLEVVLIAPARPDGAGGVAVHGGRCMQPVPVDDGRFGQAVVQAGRQARAAFDSQDRVLEDLASLFGLIQQERRGTAVEKRKARRAGANFQWPGDVQHAERSACNRDEQLLPEVLGSHGIEGVVAKRAGDQRLRTRRSVIHPGGP